ncbi:hypothetical protein C8T65DRAFT_627275 [Cerioporus squamosus]|nr:hypothetical protein C8T65DRAFT_627275 [Cerioporus squamosus]
MLLQVVPGHIEVLEFVLCLLSCGALYGRKLIDIWLVGPCGGATRARRCIKSSGKRVLAATRRTTRRTSSA